MFLVLCFGRRRNRTGCGLATSLTRYRRPCRRPYEARQAERSIRFVRRAPLSPRRPGSLTQSRQGILCEVPARGSCAACRDIAFPLRGRWCEAPDEVSPRWNCAGAAGRAGTALGGAAAYGLRLIYYAATCSRKEGHTLTKESPWGAAFIPTAQGIKPKASEFRTLRRSDAQFCSRARFAIPGQTQRHLHPIRARCSRQENAPAYF